MVAATSSNSSTADERRDAYANSNTSCPNSISSPGPTASLDYAILRIINPDEIAVTLNPRDPDAVAAAAGSEALLQREVALARGETFAIETTFSGNSERRLIEAAMAQGYRVTMTYVALKHSEDNVSRVERRAAIERRTVPAEVVRRRYERSLTMFCYVADTLDRLDVFDDSRQDFQAVLTLERGRIVAAAPDMPAWTRRALRVQLERDRGIER